MSNLPSSFIQSKNDTRHNDKLLKSDTWDMSFFFPHAEPAHAHLLLMEMPQSGTLFGGQEYDIIHVCTSQVMKLYHTTNHKTCSKLIHLTPLLIKKKSSYSAITNTVEKFIPNVLHISGIACKVSTSQLRLTPSQLPVNNYSL